MGIACIGVVSPKALGTLLFAYLFKAPEAISAQGRWWDGRPEWSLPHHEARFRHLAACLHVLFGVFAQGCYLVFGQRASHARWRAECNRAVGNLRALRYNEPAPIRQFDPTRASSRTMAPMPISVLSPMVHPCRMAPCPTVTPSPTTSGDVALT